MRKKIEQNKEVFIVIAVIGVLGLILAVTALIGKDNGKKVPPPAETAIQEVKIRVPATAGSNQPKTPTQPTSFFLRPTATDILTQIEQLGPYELEQKTHELPGLNVAWPVFFFQLQKMTGDIATVAFDTSASGFGVAVICAINIRDYPQVSDLAPGQQVWVAGEITAVDPLGTGTIFIQTKYIGFNEEEMQQLIQQQQMAPTQ